VQLWLLELAFGMPPATCSGAQNADSYLTESSCSEITGCSTQSNIECPNCQKCLNGGCSNKDAHTQDTVGSNTCTDTCKECYGGSCVNQAEDEDIFSQCGEVGCDGGATTPYFFEFVSESCYYRLNVTAENAKCGSTGSCKSAGYYCPSQPIGPFSGTSCDCSAAEIDCTGIMAGSCNNSICTTTTTTSITTTTADGGGGHHVVTTTVPPTTTLAATTTLAPTTTLTPTTTLSPTTTLAPTNDTLSYDHPNPDNDAVASDDHVSPHNGASTRHTEE